MNYQKTMLLAAILFLVSGCDQLQNPGSGNSQSAESGTDTTTAAGMPSGETVATVNGTVITQDIVDIYTRQRAAKAPGSDEDPDTILNELVTLELMRQEAVAKGINSQPAVIATVNQLERSTLAGAAMKAFMASNPVTDEAAQALYDEKFGTPGKEYNARHILVETEEEAGSIIGMLDTGSDFSELAKEKSTGPSGPSGGNLGWFSSSQMVKPFSDATAALEKGSYTKTPVQTQFGWHVIMLDDVRDSTPPPFEDVKERIKTVLANQQLQEHIDSLKSNSVIEIR